MLQPSFMAVLIGLGFTLALLSTMIAGCIFWIARKKGMPWQQKQDELHPIARLEAERDQLKAELAMLARRFELSEKEYKARLAERMAEIARYQHRLEQVSLHSSKVLTSPKASSSSSP